jgi:hypothetical protein
MLWDATMKSTTNAGTSASLPVVMKNANCNWRFVSHTSKWQAITINRYLLCMVFLAISNKKQKSAIFDIFFENG